MPAGVSHGTAVLELAVQEGKYIVFSRRTGQFR